MRFSTFLLAATSTTLALAGCAPTAQPPLGTPVSAERAFQAFREICLDHGPTYQGSIAEYRRQGFRFYREQFGADVVLHPTEDMTFLVLLNPGNVREAKCGIRVRTPADVEDFLRVAQRYGIFEQSARDFRNDLTNSFRDRDGTGHFAVPSQSKPSGQGYREMEIVALNYGPDT